MRMSLPDGRVRTRSGWVMATALVLGAIAWWMLSVASDPVRAAPAPGCLGTAPGTMVPERPGPPLRFGITPGAVAGQVGAPATAKPEDAGQTLGALQDLRRPGAPFVLRLNRVFWSEGEAGIERFLALAHRYTAAGFEVELQLRFQPPPGHSGDIAGWVDFVREVVRRFGPDPGVVGMQVTNEVNFTASPDSSDGANAGAKDALIQGVIAAHDEAGSRGFRQLRIGFNWFYRTDPQSEQAFWTYLGQHGGRAFAAAVDWVGLDAYPGTFFPPAEAPGGERDGVTNALSSLRDCYLPLAAIGLGTPIYVEENGYPTGPGRSEATQLAYLRSMVQAFSDLRGTYDVSDYRWFNLRDADSSSPNFQQQLRAAPRRLLPQARLRCLPGSRRCPVGPRTDSPVARAPPAPPGPGPPAQAADRPVRPRRVGTPWWQAGSPAQLPGRPVDRHGGGLGLSPHPSCDLLPGGAAGRGVDASAVATGVAPAVVAPAPGHPGWRSTRGGPVRRRSPAHAAGALRALWHRAPPALIDPSPGRPGLGHRGLGAQDGVASRPGPHHLLTARTNAHQGDGHADELGHVVQIVAGGAGKV